MDNTELREKVSRILGLKYVVADRHFVTETGVTFSFSEVEGNTPEEIKNIYKARYDMKDLFDYNYAKTTGYLRRKRGYFQASDETEDEKNLATMLGFGALNFILVIALVTVGLGAIYMSFNITSEYLQGYLDNSTSMILSFTMIVFATSAFEVALILWQQRISTAMPVLLMFLWFCVTVFSMNSTMSVNYNGYQTMKKTSIESKSKENSGRLLLPVIEKQIESIESQVKILETSIDNYISKEEYSEWRASEMRKELSTLIEKRNELVAEQKKILTETPESVIIADTSDRTYFDSVGDITGMKPETLSFILNAFPAVFIDLIAPFSFAAALMLLNNKKKKRGYTND